MLFYTNQSSFDEELILHPFLLFIVSYSVLFLIIIFGNGFVILVYFKNKPVRVIRFNGHIVALAVTDILIALISLPFFVHGHIFPSNRFSAWTLFRDWAFRFPLVLSVFVFIIISYDRLRLVTNPIKYHTSKSYKTSTDTVIFAWMVSGCYASLYDVILLISFALFLPPMQKLDRFDEDLLMFLTKCGQVVIYFLVPLSILLATNLKFFVRWNRDLEASRPNSNDRSGGRTMGSRSTVIYENETFDVAPVSTIPSGNNEPTDPLPSDTARADLRVRFVEPHEGDVLSRRNRRTTLHKTAKNLLLLEAAYLISWLPINIIMCLRIFITLPSLLVHMGYLMLFLNSAVNPLIFTAIAPTIRNAMYHNICLLKATLIKVRGTNSSSN